MRGLKPLFAVAVAAMTIGGAEAQDARKTPYFASISAGQALMRTGPGRNYPATWLYQRADLPVKVVETYPDWRKVQDPGGETGRMLQRLLSEGFADKVDGGGDAQSDDRGFLQPARQGL